MENYFAEKWANVLLKKWCQGAVLARMVRMVIIIKGVRVQVMLGTGKKQSPPAGSVAIRNKRHRKKQRQRRRERSEEEGYIYIDGVRDAVINTCVLNAARRM